MKRFAVIITTIFFKLFYRVEVENADKIPSEGAAILCSSHKSMLDMFFLGYDIKRWVHWMAKEELFRNPITRAIYSSLGAFPVKRGKGDVGSIKTAYKILQEG
ncbi:MAG: 1-acyl-sn-glycerol-3-phosphate acyltransferase, partial [Clostridiales bacterium]|nr:1-acyl-sn-glycerol-3-phosphate acyltransferase [Clostridiales bacterium]